MLGNVYALKTKLYFWHCFYYNMWQVSAIHRATQQLHNTFSRF